MVASGCGCNDYVPLCYTLSIRFAPNAVPSGGSVEITTRDGLVVDCANTEDFLCEFNGDMLFLQQRPQKVDVHILDSAGVEVAVHEFSPRYTGENSLDACGGGCSDLADIRVPALR